MTVTHDNTSPSSKSNAERLEDGWRQPKGEREGRGDRRKWGRSDVHGDERRGNESADAFALRDNGQPAEGGYKGATRLQRLEREEQRVRRAIEENEKRTLTRHPLMQQTKRKRRWDVTEPVEEKPSGEWSQEALGASAPRKRRSRWDATPADVAENSQRRTYFAPTNDGVRVAGLAGSVCGAGRAGTGQDRTGRSRADGGGAGQENQERKGLDLGRDKSTGARVKQCGPKAVNQDKSCECATTMSRRIGVNPGQLVWREFPDRGVIVAGRFTGLGLRPKHQTTHITYSSSNSSGGETACRRNLSVRDRLTGKPGP
ncbi:hypothetical protein EDB89DRAFT_1908725 [Lactarius sanguifluus]|nr:hypothetical protein EDB89DRAFT_1908725 [Lactarius sanguifluus]